MSNLVDGTIAKMQLELDRLEIDIKTFIRENAFYLSFNNKGWAAAPAGQKLIEMTICAINLGYDIAFLRNEHRLSPT